MNKTIKIWAGRLMLIALPAIFFSQAGATELRLDVKIEGLKEDGSFPDEAAFCLAAGMPSETARNVSPALSWSKGPEGTRSYVVLMTDPDVPADFSQINKQGITIPEESLRISVFHWVLADIPANLTKLAQGVESSGFIIGGKPTGPTDHGVRGANVYTTFLASDKEMAGVYGGYDGPCPPVNDAIPHRYQIRVMALDTDRLGLSGPFSGEDAEQAMIGHVLAEGSTEASYTLNPALRGTSKQ